MIPLAAIMVLMVTFVSSFIHLYSVSFMRDDEDYVRFFCYMNLFVFAMLVVTLSETCFFVPGLGRGGFLFLRPDRFLVHRCGQRDCGPQSLSSDPDRRRGLWHCHCFLFRQYFDDLSLSSINAQAASLSPGMATVLGILLLWAAVGKSAQLPLAVWLPDAMAALPPSPP